MEHTIDLNNAPLDELRTMPGVGPTLAERIIAARPFESIEEIRNVSGVGPALFERLAPFLVLEPSETQEDDVQAEAVPPLDETETTPEVDVPAGIDKEPIPEPTSAEELVEVPEDEASEPEPQAEPIPKDKAIIPVKEPETEKTKSANPVTWGRVLLLVTAFSLGSFVFAVLLTLGIIGSINNGLRYVSPSDLGALNRQYDNLDSQIGIVLDDIESLRSRLDNLESISTQVDELTTATEQLNADMAITVDIVTEMESQIEELESSTADFQAFLDGLSGLLTSLAEPAQEGAPQEAP